MPEEIKQEWLASRNILRQLKQLEIPSCVLPTGEVEELQLHLFTDASEKTYSANVYSRISSTVESIACNLLIAKTRVAPVKTVSLKDWNLAAGIWGHL